MFLLLHSIRKEKIISNNKFFLNKIKHYLQKNVLLFLSVALHLFIDRIIAKTLNRKY